MPPRADVVIVGAGASGISAAIALRKLGLAVIILEARERIGGRIFTLRDPVWQAPVELGAEFIHGRPPEILNLLKRPKVHLREVKGDSWCASSGRLEPCSFFSDVDRILAKMDERKPDLSFLQFINSLPKPKTSRQQQAKKRAIQYVSGFNAADPSRVGVHWLVQGMRAEEKIEGDRAFRAGRGYEDLLEILRRELDESGVFVRTGAVVERIQWQPGQVEVGARGPGGVFTVSASMVLITVPLGVLQARRDQRGSIRFMPDLPQSKQDAIRNGMMGKVIRVTLRFRERFWKGLPSKAKPRVQRGKANKTMDNMSFLLSDDDWFPTWWTMHPKKLPFLVGWAPFHCAERLSGRNESFVVEHCIRSLHRLLGVSVKELNGLLEHAYSHDWQNDPFSRGAYSYGKAGAEGAQAALAQSISNTLFFAGEATDVGGHNGTVHGAIASGRRAADEIARAAGARLTPQMDGRKSSIATT